MNRILVIVPDGEGGDYNQYVLAPEGMDERAAQVTVDKIIERVKDQNPEDYQWSEIEAELKHHGFFALSTATTNNNW